MQTKQLFQLVQLLMLLFILAACGGSGGSSPGGTGTNSGILVDPYIVGAQLEEVTADGLMVIQRSALSSTSTSGRFSFPNAFTDGSIIRIKSSTRGTHANAPFAGLLKRQFSGGDTGPIIVSPLTTLVANGMTPTEVVELLNSSGLSGLTERDVFSDPLESLNSRTGTVTAAELSLLQANMAANTYMEAIQDFDFADNTTTPVHLADCVAMIKELLSPARYQEMSDSLGSDFTVGDLAQTAVIITRTVVNDIQQEINSGNQNIPIAAIEQFMHGALTDISQIAENFYQARTGNSSGSGGGNSSANNANGENIFTTICSDCHSNGTSSSFMNLANDGAAVEVKFAGNAAHEGNTLSATDIADLAAYLNNQTAATPQTGGDLYATECQGCHGTLQASDITVRTAAGIEAAITTVNEMNNLILSAAEADLIAAALAGETPLAERTGQQVYNQECAVCHTLDTHDTSGTFGDLAGLGTTIIAKIEGNHQSKFQAITSAELTALANFADTFSAASAPTGNNGSCDSCHGQPPAGNSFPDTAGAHAVHIALAEVGADCDNCHAGAEHNDWVDLAFPAKWDAASGVATDNGDGTCSNIICHGGERTPDWSTGSINVNTQCSSCHNSRSSQFNSYSSGDHRDHRGMSCSNCHDANKLATGGHFSGLSTTDFEQAPASSLKTSLSYNPSTRRCQSCHGSETW